MKVKIPGTDIEVTEEQLKSIRNHFTSYQPEQIKNNLKEVFGEVMPNLDWAQNLNQVLPALTENLKNVTNNQGNMQNQLKALSEHIIKTGGDPADILKQLEVKKDPQLLEASYQQRFDKEKADFLEGHARETAMSAIVNEALALGLKPNLKIGFAAQLEKDIKPFHNEQDRTKIHFKNVGDDKPILEGDRYGDPKFIAKQMFDKYKDDYFTNKPGGFGEPASGGNQGGGSGGDNHDPNAKMSKNERLNQGLTDYFKNNPQQVETIQ